MVSKRCSPGKRKSRNAYAAPGGANTFVPSTSNKKIHFSEMEYQCFSNVALFDAHNGNEEGLDIDFTPDVLAKIVKACNNRYEDTGDAIPVTAGHTTDDKSEPQPEILGYAVNFRIADFGKVKPRKCI